MTYPAYSGCAIDKQLHPANRCRILTTQQRLLAEGSKWEEAGEGSKYNNNGFNICATKIGTIKPSFLAYFICLL